MLNQQVVNLQESLQMSGNKIAEYAGFSKTVISALKSGAKQPKRDSSIISKYADAVCRLAADTGKTGQLTALIGAEAYTPPRELKPLLIRWLYSRSEHTDTEGNVQVFSGNLRKIMACLDMSGAELARLSDISKSQMARILNDEATRLPDDNHIQKICSALIIKTSERNRATDVSHQLNCSLDVLLDEPRFRSRLYKWLCDPFGYSDPDISVFLQNIQKLQHPPKNSLSKIEQIFPETEQPEDVPVYYGKKGLQDASIRFLQCTLKAQQGLPGGKTELYLFSNQSIDWMLDPDFLARWSALMTACVRSGIRIKIIHNFNRSIRELADAVDHWLPLYMSGMIEPYYIRGDSGDFFSNTLFLCPLHACVSGGNPVGSEPYGVYRYDTDKKLLRNYKKLFSALLRNASPILSAVPGLPDEDVMKTLVFPEQFPEVGISSDSNVSLVVKVEEPQITFTIYHPSIKKALQFYLDPIKP